MTKMTAKKAPIIILVTLVVLAMTIALTTNKSQDIYSFQDCKDADGQIAEIYPETCYHKGKSFINSNQATSYEGLTEQDALDKAKSQNTPARVIERDGVGLPTTIDFSEGRLNFFVRDGKVYRVNIESTSH